MRLASDWHIGRLFRARERERESARERQPADFPTPVRRLDSHVACSRSGYSLCCCCCLCCSFWGAGTEEDSSVVRHWAGAASCSWWTSWPMLQQLAVPNFSSAGRLTSSSRAVTATSSGRAAGALTLNLTRFPPFTPSSTCTLVSRFTLGFTSPYDLTKPKDKGGFNLSNDENSLFGSMVNVGAMVGSLLGGSLLDFAGRSQYVHPGCLICLCTLRSFRTDCPPFFFWLPTAPCLQPCFP